MVEIHGTPVTQPAITPSGDSYCTQTDIEDLLKPQLQFGDLVRRGEVSQDDIDHLIDDACGIVESDLSHMYAVPFRKFDSHGIMAYPQQVVTATTLKVSSLLLNKYFGETEPSLSERAKELDDRYTKLISSLESGGSILRGQRRRAKSHFVSPGIQEAPNTISANNQVAG